MVVPLVEMSSRDINRLNRDRPTWFYNAHKLGNCLFEFGFCQVLNDIRTPNTIKFVLCKGRDVTLPTPNANPTSCAKDVGTQTMVDAA